MHVEITFARPVLTYISDPTSFSYAIAYWEVRGMYRESEETCACENKPFTKQLKLNDPIAMKVSKKRIKELCEEELKL